MQAQLCGECKRPHRTILSRHRSASFRGSCSFHHRLLASESFSPSELVRQTTLDGGGGTTSDARESGREGGEDAVRTRNLGLGHLSSRRRAHGGCVYDLGEEYDLGERTLVTPANWLYDLGR